MTHEGWTRWDVPAGPITSGEIEACRAGEIELDVSTFNGAGCLPGCLVLAVVPPAVVTGLLALWYLVAEESTLATAVAIVFGGLVGLGAFYVVSTSGSRRLWFHERNVTEVRGRGATRSKGRAGGRTVSLEHGIFSTLIEPATSVRPERLNARLDGPEVTIEVRIDDLRSDDRRRLLSLLVAEYGEERVFSGHLHQPPPPDPGA